MEASIVATALITIAETFNNYITVQWVVLAYLLSYMGFSVIVVRLSDVFGRKWIVISVRRASCVGIDTVLMVHSVSSSSGLFHLPAVSHSQLYS